MRQKYLNSSSKNSFKVCADNFLKGANLKYDSSILDFSSATLCHNFDFSSGVLTAGYGIEHTNITRTDVNNMWVYKWYDVDIDEYVDTIMFAVASGDVYYFDKTNTEKKLEYVHFDTAPLALNYRLYGSDVVIMCSSDGKMFVWDYINDAYSIEDSPQITSMAVHFERLFVTIAGEKNAVWFSDDLDPTNWNFSESEGGFIQLIDDRGRSNKVVSFLNYIYIFRDYGISRLSAYASQDEFNVSNLYVSSSEIYPNSVTVCGDCIMFLASDGLYKFDGVSTTKVLTNIIGQVSDNKTAVATFFEGKYYLSLNLGYYNGFGVDESDCKNNTLIVFDTKTKEYSLSKGLGIIKFCAYKKILFVVDSDNKVGQINKSLSTFNKSLTAKWQSSFTDFGTNNVKNIKEFRAESNVSFYLTIKTEKSEKTIKVIPNNDNLCSSVLNVSGRKIGIGISCIDAKVRIAKPTLIGVV